MFTDANKLECLPLSTGTFVLASFQNSTNQTKKLNFSNLLRRCLMNAPCLRLAFPQIVLLSILKAFSASNGDSIKTSKRYQSYYESFYTWKKSYVLVGINKTLPDHNHLMANCY